jgi:hypothetical protein
MEFNYKQFLTENKLTTGSKLKSLVENRNYTDDMEDTVSNDAAYEKAFDYMDNEEVVEVEDMEDDMSDSEPTAKDVKSNKSTGDLAKKQYQLASLIKHKDDLVMKFKSGELTIDQYKEKIGNIPQHIKKLSLDIENLESQDTF